MVVVSASVIESQSPAPQSPPPIYVLEVRRDNQLYTFLDSAGRDQQRCKLSLGDLVRIGAHADNDLRLEGDEIAQHHAHISYQSAGVVVRRIATRKDVQLNQKSLVPWKDEPVWQVGEELSIGPYRLWLTLHKPGAAEPPQPLPASGAPPAGDTPLPAGVVPTPGTVGVALERSGQPLQLTPGAASRWRLYLLNRDDRSHTFVIEVKTSPPLSADWTAREAEILVQAGRRADVDLDVYAPRTPANQAGSYRLAVTVRSLTDTTVAATIEREVIVGAFTQPPLVEIQLAARYYSSARYTVRVTNPTNTIVSYRLAAADDGGDLECTFHPKDDGHMAFAQNSLVVQPGATESVTLVARVRTGRSVAKQGYVAWVEVRPLGQAPVRARAIFEPRWVSPWRIERRAALRALLWIAAVAVLVGIIYGVQAMMMMARQQVDDHEMTVFNARASAYLAAQVASINANLANTAVIGAQTAAPFQTSTAALADTSKAIGASLAQASATLGAVASTATAGAQQVPGQLTAAAQAAQSMSTQVGAVAAATVQAGRDQQTAQAAPVQTIMAAQTAQAISEQNATTVNAAAAQGAAAVAAATAAEAATKVAIETKPVSLVFKSQPLWEIDKNTSSAKPLGPVIVGLLDKNGNVPTRSGYLIQLTLIGCRNVQLVGTKIQSSKDGLITFDDLAIVDEDLSTAPTGLSCKLHAEEINGHLKVADSNPFNIP